MWYRTRCRPRLGQSPPLRAIKGGAEPVLVAELTAVVGDVSSRCGCAGWTGSPDRIRGRKNYVLGGYGTPKSRSARSVPMADLLAGELERLIRRAGATGDDDLVFRDLVTGGPPSKAAILRRLRGAARGGPERAARVPRTAPHARDVHGGGGGCRCAPLQEWMGHHDPETTQRYADYAPAPAHERELVGAALDVPAVAVPSVLARVKWSRSCITGRCKVSCRPGDLRPSTGMSASSS